MPERSYSLSKLTAIVRNPSDDGWLRYREPFRLIVAREVDEVMPALAAIEEACAGGATAVGYVAYDAAPAFDTALECQRGTLPLLLFGLYRGGDACDLPSPGPATLALAPEMGKPAFTRNLERIRDHLGAGDTYQVNFTQRLVGFCDHDPLQLFSDLYQAQPSALAAYLEWDELAICSVSPELFFAVDGEDIVMEPMKGTRPRHEDPRTDRRLRDELLSSDKEKAENLMIVDMVRNDLGRIAESGSIGARQLFRIVELPTVWQQVSSVGAKTGAGLAQLFAALFPCASITGAPKASTMKIIRNLETSPRGIYTGAIGIVRPNRHMRFSVAIRTLVIDRSRQFAEYGIGSGIVWDSRSDSEWLETLQKSRLLHRSEDDFSLLETLRFDPGEGVSRLPRHLARLRASAAYFGIDAPLETIAEALERIEFAEATKLRLLVSPSGEYAIESSAAPANTDPVRLCLAARPVNSRDPFLRHKTTERRVYQALRAIAADCDDVILFNEHGELTETTIYNLYLEIDGELLTPAAESGLLPGTLRQELLESGRAREEIIKVGDLERATNLFVSNSVRGLCEATLLSR